MIASLKSQCSWSCHLSQALKAFDLWLSEALLLLPVVGERVLDIRPQFVDVGDDPLVVPPELFALPFLCWLLVFKHAQIIYPPPVLFLATSYFVVRAGKLVIGEGPHPKQPLVHVHRLLDLQGRCLPVPERVGLSPALPRVVFPLCFFRSDGPSARFVVGAPFL